MKCSFSLNDYRNSENIREERIGQVRKKTLTHAAIKWEQRKQLKIALTSKNTAKTSIYTFKHQNSQFKKNMNT